jgi:CubicO group peptidase (beta-lactamase class C family)
VSDVAVAGHVAPGFERVREAFARSFAEHGDVGAACCVYLRGQPVVDLWGGLADRASARPWNEDTLQLVFSATKGVTAICLNVLAERGLVDLDAPVASYWPEFGANGKAHIPLRWVMSHRAGVAAVDGDHLTLDDVLAWDPVVAAIAAQAPNWEPGSKHGYHARSYGWVTGEVVRRVTGKTLGRFFADEIAAPLGLDFFIGLPEREEPRVATLYPAESSAEVEAFFQNSSLLARVITGPARLFGYDDMWNRRALRAAELPSSNGIGTARALARLYAAVIGELDGCRLLRPDTLAGACRPQSEGPDAVLGVPLRFGTGFMLPPGLGPSAPANAFGHPGAGGSLAMADAERGVAIAYVMNQMRLGMLGDPRADGIVGAVYASLR